MGILEPAGKISELKNDKSKTLGKKRLLSLDFYQGTEGFLLYISQERLNNNSWKWYQQLVLRRYKKNLYKKIQESLERKSRVKVSALHEANPSWLNSLTTCSPAPQIWSAEHKESW